MVLPARELAVAPARFADVTIVIPAKDEAQTVGDIVARCRQLVDRVYVIDGHSTDATAPRAAAAGATVVRDANRGKGEALRRAVPLVATEITVFLDADGSHDPEDMARLVQPIRDGVADHVTASRLLGGSSELHGGFDEFVRLAGSSFITACVNRRFGVRLSDTQNGFRAIRTTVLRELALREDSTTIEQEMIMQTLRRGYRMAEVACHEYARRHGRSHVRPLRAAPRYFWSLVRGLWF